MSDRRSDSSYDGIVEEANVAMKMDVATFHQLSTSAQAAQQNRAKGAIYSLDNAAKKLKISEQGGGSKTKKSEQVGNASKREGQGQSGQK